MNQVLNLSLTMEQAPKIRFRLFSQSVLNKVQAQDLGEVGSSLTDLMFNLQQANPNELVAENKGIFTKMFGKVKRSNFLK